MNSVACIILLLLGIVVQSHGLVKEQYPPITANNSACWSQSTPRPAASLRICDPDRIVSASQADEIQKALIDIRALKSCPCRRTYCDVQRLMGRDRGYTVTVALVKTMGDNVGTDLVAAARDYAVYLRSNRGYFGSEFSRCQDDIIVFVSFEEQVVYVLTGTAAMSAVTNEEIEDMIADSAESFRNQLADGILFLLDRIKKEIEKEVQTQARAARTTSA